LRGKELSKHGREERGEEKNDVVIRRVLRGVLRSLSGKKEKLGQRRVFPSEEPRGGGRKEGHIELEA